ncbi:DUF1266 domain-containing protein [Amycolatopsis jiangsuensis]|uniref:DUF1266 domain-containing protein n=1 Tax=Amycolatopsis jiangsuensis TaxID=1181879 RepID=A0A840IN86_9PSEU|nr:DUF1266 domain-containing protein [Amycolatopsis jiangsuensis]MBB4683019.1 hypothetical protein [Amycolatopsis jiangsuensis]
MTWAAAVDVEAELTRACRDGDLDRFLGLLGDEELFVPIHRDQAEQLARERVWVPARICCAHEGEPSLQVFTRGAVPDLGAGVVFLSGDLDWATCGLGPGEQVVFNRGTSAQWRVDASVVQPWLDANPHRLTAVEQQVERLNTVSYGHLDGPIARALACGVPQAVLVAEPWNLLDARYHDYVAEVRGLRDWWGVTDTAGWRAAVDGLLGDRRRFTPEAVALALRTRGGAELDPLSWARLVASWCAENDLSGQADALVDAVRRIVRYEQRLRADAVLPPDAVVGSTFGWDVARVLELVRRGLAVGHCDELTAELQVLEAGALARRYHESWAQLSAGFVLGRVLALDEEQFGEHYRSAVRVHHLLLNDPASPWWNLGFADEPTGGRP